LSWRWVSLKPNAVLKSLCFQSPFSEHDQFCSSAKQRPKPGPGKGRTALVPRQASDPALANAVSFWADATTSGSSLRRHKINRDKSNAVLSFFGFAGKYPAVEGPVADRPSSRAALEFKLEFWRILCESFLRLLLTRHHHLGLRFRFFLLVLNHLA
jgi:hypothetical protein